MGKATAGDALNFYEKLVATNPKVERKAAQENAELKKYFDISYAYVGSLKPKPTPRKKKPS